jgi:zinc protease
MLHNVRFTLLAVSALALSAWPQTLPQGVQKVTSVEGITEYSLPNGLRVLLFPDQSQPKVTVNITYLVGSRLEGYGETGMAHLMEHILFLRTKADKDIKKDITDHGAIWNGTTAWDRTNYFETMTASDENLHWAIQLEADRMVNMRVEKALLDKEMTVVRNEFEMGENSPTRMLYQRTLETAYTFHAYGRLPIGSRSDIEHVSIEHLAAFYHKYYQPDDALLTIAGKFEEPKALAWVVEAFGSIPRPTRVLEKTYTEEPTQDGERAVTLRRTGDDQAISVLYHVPATTHADTAALNVLAAILGDNPSGRLYKALVDNKKAVSAGMDVEELHDPGYMMSFIRLRLDQSLDEARDIALKTIEGFLTEPPSKEEVDRAKTRLLKQMELDLTNSQNVGLAISEYAAAGDWRLIYHERDETRKVTEQDVVRVAKAYLKPSNRTLGEFIPTKTPDRAEIPAAPDGADLMKDYKGGVAIAQGEAFDPSPANIDARLVHSKLPNGMKLALLSKKTRGGTVYAQVRLDFGDEKAVFGKGYAAQLAGALLIRGTKSKSRQQIQDEIDKLKARIFINGAATNATANMETTEENLPGALRLVAEVLREPLLAEDEFEKLKQQRLAGIESNKSDPQALASIELSRRLNPYPRGDIRYTGTFDEQAEDVKKVTIAEVRQFYAQFYGASDAKLVVSGQFNTPEIQKLAAELFGSWKSPRPYQRVITGYQKTEAMDRKIETPDKQNAVFFAAMQSKMSDSDRDYPSMLIANYVFGGSGGSRLFKRIRDKEGLSYGVQSQFSALTKAEGATFVMFAISNPQNSPKVEASIKDELARTLKDGFTAEEVAAAKKSWLAEQTVQRSQDQGLLAGIMGHERFDLTYQYDADLEAKVAALTPEQVSDAFRRRVSVDGLAVVKAGDFKKAAVFQ